MKKLISLDSTAASIGITSSMLADIFRDFGTELPRDKEGKLLKGQRYEEDLVPSIKKYLSKPMSRNRQQRKITAEWYEKVTGLTAPLLTRPFIYASDRPKPPKADKEKPAPAPTAEPGPSAPPTPPAEPELPFPARGASKRSGKIHVKVVPGTPPQIDHVETTDALIAEVKTLRKDLKGVEENNKLLQGNYVQAKETITDQKEHIATLNGKLADANAVIDRLSSEAVQRDKNVEELVKRVERYEKEDKKSLQGYINRLEVAIASILVSHGASVNKAVDFREGLKP